MARVLVIGAGPAGLATAACLAAEGVSFRLVDRRGATGGAYREISDAITLSSPRRYTGLPGSPPEGSEYVTVPEYRAYLERYAAQNRLTAEKAEVVSLAREDGGLVARFTSGESARFDAVVVATGMWDSPQRPEIPGLGPPLEVLHSRDWRGPKPGSRVLVVGGATSAVEIAEECARAAVSVTVSARSGVKVLPQRFLGRDVHDYAWVFESLPRFLVARHCDRWPTLPGTDLGWSGFVRDGKIRVKGPLARFEGASAIFEDGSRDDFDTVVLATGFRYPVPFLPPEVARARAGHVRTKDGESTSWPGLFFVGTPCGVSVASEFLRGIARDAPLVARRIRDRLEGRSERRGSLLALLPLAFVGAHAIHLARHSQLEHLFWSCNVANFLLAAGLGLGRAGIVAVAWLWLAIGIPCWSIDLATGGEFVPTQLLTHLGALAVATLGVKRLGMPRGSWWRAMLAHIALQQVTRLFTPPAENINLAFDVFESSKPWFPSYAVYYVVVTALFCAFFFAGERLAARFLQSKA